MSYHNFKHNVVSFVNCWKQVYAFANVNQQSKSLQKNDININKHTMVKAN